MEHTIGIIGAERIRVFRSMDPVRPNIREKLNIHITNTTLTDCLFVSASKSSIRRFAITEKAPTSGQRLFSKHSVLIVS